MKSVNQLASGRGDDPALSGGSNNHQGLYKPQGVGGGGKNQTDEQEEGLAWGAGGRRRRVTFPRTRKQPLGTGEDQDSTDPTLEPPEGAQR